MRALTYGWFVFIQCIFSLRVGARGSAGAVFKCHALYVLDAARAFKAASIALGTTSRRGIPGIRCTLRCAAAPWAHAVLGPRLAGRGLRSRRPLVHFLRGSVADMGWGWGV